MVQLQARAAEEEDEYYERDPQTASSAPPSVGNNAVSSRLSALKARLEAERIRGNSSDAVR